MSDNNHSSGRQVRSGSRHVERFQEKFGSHPEGEGKSVPKEAIPGGKEPGVLEKLRLRVQQTGKAVWRWPADKKEQVTYKVRGGKLTVTDEDGRVIQESKEKGLGKYNGMTLRGKANGKGEIALKENSRNRGKLEQGNAHLTPREHQEQAEHRQAKLLSWPVKFGRITKKVGVTAFRGGKKVGGTAIKGGKKIGQKWQGRSRKP